MSGPQVTIDLDRIERNARAVVSRCAQSGIKVFGVTKGTCGMPQVARAMLRGGVAGIAESRFENIRRLRESGIAAPIMLLRSPPMARVEEVVRTVDISLQSELAIIRELSRIAERMGRVHDIILMIDLGDLREGIWPSDLLPTVEQVLELKGVRIAGRRHQSRLLRRHHADRGKSRPACRACLQDRAADGHAASTGVSGGNSSSLPLLLEGRMPEGINNLRVGEAILQGGLETFRDTPWEALELDACRLSSDVIEVKKKPSRPIGRSGYDAFGNQPVFVDEGDRLRAIANIGREDVFLEGLDAAQQGRARARRFERSSAAGCHRRRSAGRGWRSHLVPHELWRDAGGDDFGICRKDADSRCRGGREHARMAQIVADPEAGAVLARQDARGRLEAMGYDVVELGDAARPPAGLMCLAAGADRRMALSALAASVKATHSLGLIWIDSRAALEVPERAEAGITERSVLAQALGLIEKPGPLQPQLSPENVVLVGLREATPQEAADPEEFARHRLHHDRHRRVGDARRDARGAAHRHDRHARLPCQLFADR